MAIHSSLDALSDRSVRVEGCRFVENGAGTYTFDVLVPAYSVILDTIVYAEALWTAGTSASLEVGDYAFTSGAIGAAIDADGFFTAIDLKATDLLAGESLSWSFGGAAADLGAYLDGTATHVLARTSASDRIIRFSIVSVGAGTAGRTVVGIVYAKPRLREVTQ